MQCKAKIRSRRLPREFREPPPLAASWRPTRVAERSLLFVNPFYAKDPHASFGKHVLTPSLALTSLAGATPADWQARYHDENLLHGSVCCDPFPNVVAITVHLTFARRAYELARWFRERGAIVVLGGLHVQSCPDEVAEHADAIVLGDGVAVWPELLRDVERGVLAPRFASTGHCEEGTRQRPLSVVALPTPPRRYVGSYRNQEYRNAPAPDRSILPRESFLTTASLIATRGCHNRCGFCYLATEGLDLPYQTLDPQQVVAQWEASDEPYAVFIDNNLGSKPDYLRALCKALEPLERIWSAAVTIDVTDDPSLVRAMALAGCTGVFVGFETLEDQNLHDAKKRSPKAKEYAERVALLHDHGIQVNGSFVLGFDHDGPEVFERTTEWVEEQRLECATFHIMTPYPGTPFFRDLESSGRILHRNWDLYDTSHVVFRPRRMSVEELAEGYAWCYQRLFSAASIWRRRPVDWRAVPAYLAMSVLYKRSNPLWRFLIRRRLVHRAWRPLVEVTRRRHLSFRKRLARRDAPGRAASVVSAGV